MKYLHNKNTFLIEREFQLILDEILMVFESHDDEQPVTFEWTFNNKTKLEKFLDKLPKEQLITYFKKFVKWVNKIPGSLKAKILIPTLSVFLIFASATDLISSGVSDEMRFNIETVDAKIDKESVEEVEVKATFDVAQEMVKKGEGGYTDDKSDPGNWVDGKLVGTNFGISAPELKDHLGHTPSKQDMEDLSYKDASKIYKKKFWNKNNLEFVKNQSVANIIYDGVVNQGRSGTKKVLQDVFMEFGMDVKMKNIFEVETIEAMNKLDQEELFNKIYDFRWERYKDTKNFKKYGDGWKNRLDEFKFSETNNI